MLLITEDVHISATLCPKKMQHLLTGPVAAHLVCLLRENSLIVKFAGPIISIKIKVGQTNTIKFGKINTCILL